MKLSLFRLAFVCFPALLVACAVESGPEASGQGAEREGETSEAMAVCTQPLTPSVIGTLNPACNTTTYVTFTTSAGYTSANCAGRVEIEADKPTPSCAFTTLDSWSVVPVAADVNAIASGDCPSSYIDYTLSGHDNAGLHVVHNARAYGVWNGYACTFAAGQPNGDDAISGYNYDAILLSAAAYRHVTLPLGASLKQPMNLTLTIKQRSQG
jgi:hypothetical protein